VPTIQQSKSIDKAVRWFEEYYGKNSVGINVLFDYFAFQFYYYTKPGAIQSKRFVGIGHIIGDKAAERWVNKNHYELQNALKWASEKHILLSEISEVVNFEENPISISALEEIERRRFFNTQYGLSNCLMLTNGYTKNSEYCVLCKWSIDCRKMKK